jgi:magnesium transporter
MVHEEHTENLIEVLQTLVDENDVGSAVSVLLSRHPADQADLIEELNEEARQRLVNALSPEQLADLLEYLEDDLRSRVLASVPPDLLAPILGQLDEDVAVDIVQDLTREQAEQVVPLLDEPEYIRELLSYPEESAGGRMSTDYVAIRRDWTIDHAIEFLRAEHPDTDKPFYLYVVDDQERLLGVVNLRSMITSAPETPIAAIMIDAPIAVNVLDDQEVAAERMRHYNLVALPVVNDDGALEGVITGDDVLDVQVEEATEDMFRMAGLAEEERLFRPIRHAAPPRLGWLMINLVTAFFATLTVNAFEGTIDRAAMLAIFMPMVAGMGGNAGIQTITLVVRSIALGEVTPNDAAAVLKHEILIALIKGVVIGLIVAVLAWIWKDNAWLGLIVGLALLANIVNATVIGVLIPMFLKRLRLDPALASGVFVTMLSDALGLLFFLGLATLLITRLT